MKPSEDLKMQKKFLADLRKVFAKFRRINSYVSGFVQPFIGTSAHRHIGTLSYRHIATLTILLLSLVSNLKAQLLTPLSNEMNRRVEYEMIQNGTPFFTVMKPYLITSSPHHLITSSTPKSPEEDFGESRDSLHHLQIDTSSNHLITSLPHHLIAQSPHHTWFHRKLFNESFIQVDSGSFYLFADPVFEFGVGRETSGRNTYINTRGFRAGGRLGKHVAFGTEFYENQGRFNSVVSEQIRKKMIAPGEGMARKYDSTGYDFANSTGYISVILLKKLNIQLAHSRQFIGDGYRSLLLSDASYPYSNLNFTWRSEFFMYSWSTLLLQDRDVDGFKKGPFRRKSANIHTVAFNIKNKAQIALVKMQLYNNPDSLSNYKLTFSQLNPILIPENNSNAHSVWGLNLKVNPLPQLVIYNQWAIDNLFGKLSKHTAMQIGSKYYGIFGNHTVYLQAEYNRVPAKTYTSDNKIFNWVHFREPLAHPYGHNFQELVLKGIWEYNRWQVSCQTVLVKQLETLPANFPPYKYSVPYYANEEKLNWYNAELAYFFNRKTLMNIALGYNYRIKTTAANTNKMQYLYFAFSTKLFNKYHDF